MEDEEAIPPVVCPSSSSSSEGDSAFTEEKKGCIEITSIEVSPTSKASSGVASAPSSPPRRPTPPSSSSAPVSPSPANSTTANRPTKHHIHPTNLKTPQMMILGKDGSDYHDLMTSRSMERQEALLEGESKTEHLAIEPCQQQLAAAAAPPSSSSTWWNRLWYGRANSTASNDNDNYTSMEDNSPPRRRAARQQQQASDVEAPVYYQGLDAHVDPLQSPAAPTNKVKQSILRKLPLNNSAREEQVQQDCSFLYRPVDELSPKPRTLRAILDPPPAGVSTLYRDAQEILSPPIMAQYKAKYQQLNQQYDRPDYEDRFGDYDDYAESPLAAAAAHELTLEEHDNRAVVTNTVAQSSLFYHDETNGRVVLRLPRDHVRLLMAGELEPGILSVIQCRRPEDPQAPTLEYCLTVPSNLYQRVVSEINHKATSAHHGSDGSFYASEHADIRWAVGIMTIIMVILGINTLVFGLD